MRSTCACTGIVTGLNARVVWEQLVDGGDRSTELVEPLPDEFHAWVATVAARAARRRSRRAPRGRGGVRGIVAALPEGWTPQGVRAAVACAPGPARLPVPAARRQGLPCRAVAAGEARPRPRPQRPYLRRTTTAMTTLTITRGLPASGKTTWARRSRPGAVRVNRDDLRAHAARRDLVGTRPGREAGHQASSARDRGAAARRRGRDLRRHQPARRGSSASCAELAARPAPTSRCATSPTCRSTSACGATRCARARARVGEDGIRDMHQRYLAGHAAAAADAGRADGRGASAYEPHAGRAAGRTRRHRRHGRADGRPQPVRRDPGPLRPAEPRR